MSISEEVPNTITGPYLDRRSGRLWEISPRAAGVIVVVLVMMVPSVPVGYLTPVAVFFGALTVFLTAARQRRRDNEHQGAEPAPRKTAD